MTPQRTSRPARSEPPPLSEPELHFCAICQVSIAAAEIDRGTAQRTPRGRAFCGVCAVATPEERARRRTALEQEFADDAPVPVPVARARRPATPAPLPVAAVVTAGAAAAPIQTRSVVVHDSMVELRVGELERAAFRLQARVATLEERLEALQRKLDGA